MDLLDWQNSCHQIKDRGQHLLQSEKWSDCRFLVGSGNNQRIIAAHKLILAMASPVFERMFYGLFPDKTDPIVIPDVQPDAFQSMLEYIYADSINISSFDKACELCYVAKKYMLPHVVEQCTHYLWADLSPKNACRAYEFARLFDEPRLMQSSMGIIAKNTREVIEDPTFLDIEFPTLMAILDQDKLNIDSELDLFNGLLRYASERGIFADGNQLPPGQDFGQHAMPPMRPLEHEQSLQVHPGGSNEHIDPSLVIEEIKMEPDVSAMMQNQEDADDNAQFPGGEQPPHVVDDVVVLDSDTSGAETDGNDEPSVSGAAGGGLHARVAAVEPGPGSVCDEADNSFNGGMMNAPARMIIDESTMRQAVKKIRFLTMTPQQFAEGPARSKLLQQHEALAILIKISSPAINDCPMPEGFCSSRCSRNFYESRQQRDFSSYFGPLSSASNPVVNLEMHPNLNNGGPQVAPIDMGSFRLNGGDLGDLTTNDTRRSYCVRTLNQQFDYRNTSVTDCGLTFQVDSNIWITGVQVPTQVLSGELMNSAGFSERYTEILYAHIQDIHGSRLAYTHCTSRVRYDSLLEVSFHRPVYIYRNQIYKVFVVFNKIGWYPMYTCLPDVVCNRVKFMFNVGNAGESVRDGLIRAIVFSTPQEQLNNMLE